MRIVRWLFIGLLLALHEAGEAQPEVRPGDNVARGKACQLEPPANYGYCTDPDDRAQLTDGVYSKGYFWTQKSTVGWSGANPAIITLDLGGIEPICGLSFNTAAGTAGVTWPMALLVFVSDDGKTYSYTGDLVELGREYGKPEADGYATHRYWTDKLGTHGRFVKLLVMPTGPYTFVDEIEIYRGHDGLVDKPLTGRKTDDVKEFFTEIAIAHGIRRRLRDDVDSVRELLEDIPLKGKLEKELASIEAGIGKIASAPGDFRTVFPMNDLHRRVFAVQAAAWRAQGIRPVVAWPKAKWEMVSPFEQPAGRATIEVRMMSNEFRSGAFLLSNAGESVADLRLAIMGLPGGANPDYVTVHEGVFTDTKKGVPVIAALPFARRDEDGYVFQLDPDTTRQVWLTFNPGNVPAGDYKGTVRVQPGGLDVPVRFKVYPFRFPDRPALHLGGWDYTNVDRMYNITPGNRAAVIQHLREHFVDTPWATSAVLQRGKYDALGNMIEEPDTKNFETWIERWPGARNYYVFLGLGSYSTGVQKKFCQFELGSPAFEKAVSNWITWWVGKLGEWGIEPEQLGLLLVDETHSHKQDQGIIDWSRAIKAAQPRVTIWEDPTWSKPWEALPELFAACDILCPNLPMWIGGGERFADFFVKQRDAGRTLWFYSCSGPGKLLDPYAYHRMQHWFCWKYDAKGSCFWAFGDSNGASSWNEYLVQRGAYTPMFLDDTTITPGKHMEAIREGMEDYEYLRMLRDRVAELEKAGRKNETVDAAKRLLSAGPGRVTACMTEMSKINWEDPKDRSIADTVRLEVLEALVKLAED